MYLKSQRPSEVIAMQREVIAQQDAIIEVLKGALAAAGCEDAPDYEPWMEMLTTQERAIVGALYASYPRPMDRFALLDLMPGHDHAEDRDAQLVSVKVCHVRKKLGDDAIETVRGVGYRLGKALHATFSEQKSEPIPFKRAA